MALWAGVWTRTGTRNVTDGEVGVRLNGTVGAAAADRKMVGEAGILAPRDSYRRTGAAAVFSIASAFHPCADRSVDNFVDRRKEVSSFLPPKFGSIVFIEPALPTKSLRIMLL